MGQFCVIEQDGERISSGIADRSDWRRGPWDTEPDKVQWVDAATGLHCLAVRATAHWCGYVGLPVGHPWRDDDRPAGVDGVPELNYGPWPCGEDGLVCHDVEGSDDVQWIGFDCASGSCGPDDRSSFLRDLPYHDLAFTRAAVTKLAVAATQARAV